MDQDDLERLGKTSVLCIKPMTRLIGQLGRVILLHEIKITLLSNKIALLAVRSALQFVLYSSNVEENETRKCPCKIFCFPEKFPDSVPQKRKAINRLTANNRKKTEKKKTKRHF